jgi:hypothetical protein
MALTIGELMACDLEDFHFLHMDEDHDVATIVELFPDTLTEQGRKDWADVLAAKVERIYQGYYGMQADISGCKAERLRDFSYMLAGDVPLSDYNRWVSDAEMLTEPKIPLSDAEIEGLFTEDLTLKETLERYVLEAQTAGKSQKSLEARLKAAQEKADAHNASNGGNKKSTKKEID